MNDLFTQKTLRLVNNAIIQIENADLIRIGVDLNNQIVIHKDLLMILPDFFGWCKVSDYLNTLPSGQEQLLEVLKNLYNVAIFEEFSEPGIEKIVLTDKNALPQSVSQSESIFFNIHNHHLMIKDFVRATAYWHAIENNVTKDDIVLELGCGSGILTFFAARAGAKKLYAIEINKNMVDTVTRPMAEDNGYANKITFLLGNSMNIPEVAVNPKATVFIAEILGDGILNENILTYTIDARDRFLAPGAKLLPKGLDVYLFAFEDLTPQGLRASADIKHIAQAKSARTDSLYLKYDTFNNKMLSNPQCAIYLDLMTITSDRFEAKGEIEIIAPGILNGCCLYFIAHIDDTFRLSNSPWSPQISWTQQLVNIYPSREVKKGDIIPFTLNYDGFLTLNLE
ncbi:MAG: class I SAM-dependent methyltransferase [Cyanobacteriota bacterium]